MKKQPVKRERKRMAHSLWKAFKSFSTFIPILLGVILLAGLFQSFVSKDMIASLFAGQVLRDTLLGTLIGSILAGNPITSYVIGGELLKGGVSLFAVTAFIVAWVTVGVIQYPAEAGVLGRRFATIRNILSFILAIFVSLATTATLMVIR